MGILGTAARLTEWALARDGYVSRSLETHGVRLRYLEARGRGELPPVLCIHGLSASAGVGYGFYRALRPHVRRVLALDLPGHGQSGAMPAGSTPDDMFAAVRDVLDVMSAEPVILFGNSLGGATALRYAALRPERVALLALQSPGGAPMSATDLGAIAALFAAASPADAVDFLARVFHRRPWYARLVARELQSELRRASVRDFLAAVRPEDTLKAEQVQSLRMPVLLQWGVSDRVLARGSLEFFRAHLHAGAVIEEPSERGHSPYLEEPRREAERLVAFARERLGAAQSPAIRPE